MYERADFNGNNILGLTKIREILAGNKEKQKSPSKLKGFSAKGNNRLSYGLLFFGVCFFIFFNEQF